MADLISIAHAAERLGVSEQTIRRLVTTGQMPSVMVGGQYRIAVSVVDGYVARARGEADLAMVGTPNMKGGRG